MKAGNLHKNNCSKTSTNNDVTSNKIFIKNGTKRKLDFLTFIVFPPHSLTITYIQLFTYSITAKQSWFPSKHFGKTHNAREKLIFYHTFYCNFIFAANIIVKQTFCTINQSIKVSFLLLARLFQYRMCFLYSRECLQN